VFTVRSAVARVRAVNRCAILHICPVVAFLSHWRAFEGEIRAVQSCVLIGKFRLVFFFFVCSPVILLIVYIA
jgi:hypothetical protein